MTKIQIFDQNSNFRPKLRFLSKIPMFYQIHIYIDQNSEFLTKFSIKMFALIFLENKDDAFLAFFEDRKRTCNLSNSNKKWVVLAVK